MGEEMGTEKLAERVIAQLDAGENETLFAACDEALQATMGSVEALGAAWPQMETMFGPYREITDIALLQEDGYDVALVTCAFERADAVLQFAFDAQERLCGMTLANFTPRADAAATEAGETVLLRAGAEDETAATLLLPEGEGPFPCVILVHGSGPADRNLSVYGMAPFRDLAEGLAARGVASIRYDKYTYAHASLCVGADFAVQREYIDDAVAAARALEEDARVSGVFIAGLSHGAMLAPRIMEQIESPKLRGAVLLEGSPLPLWKIMLAQNQAMLDASGLSGEDAAKTQAQLDAMRDETMALENLTDEQRKQTTVFGGVNGYYIWDEASFDEAAAANRLGLPLLVVQGGKDFQVTTENGLQAWKDALSPDLDVTYAFYGDMTHLLFDLAGEPTNSVADYANGAPVSQTLLDDVANWVKAKDKQKEN